MEKKQPKSVLVKSQFKKVVKEDFRIDGGAGKLIIKIRYDDECGNGHNTFTITADLYRDDRLYSAGCLHDDIERYAPELSHLIKWHLCSSDGPLHYVANTIYHAKEVKKFKYFIWLVDEELKIRTLLGIFSQEEKNKVVERFSSFKLGIEEKPAYDSKESDIEAARRSSLWFDASKEQLTDEKALKARLPELLTEFKHMIESLGFVY